MADYERRHYELRETDKASFEDSRVDFILVIDGRQHAKLAVPAGGLLSIVRKPDGLDLDIVSPGEGRITDLPPSQKSDTLPTAWQLEALRER
jgi:hypothetical protein